QWWKHVEDVIPAIKQVGFTALWLPPAGKAFPGDSMGYAPYDYFDLGEFDQKGKKEVWFGSKDDLIHLIKAAHDNEMQVYADIVINHNSGADDQELNPLNNAMRWTKFTPKSGKFNRDWTCFHPCRFETFDDGTFGDMPDLCHRNPYVFQQLLEYARWSVEEI